MKYLFLLLPCVLFGQSNYINQPLFTAGADSVGSTTAQDTLDFRGYIGGADEGSWVEIINYISANEKSAGTMLRYDLANESTWTWFEMVTFRLRSSGGDTITTKSFLIGNTDGNITLFIVPDTSAFNKTNYTTSRIGGN